LKKLFILCVIVSLSALSVCGVSLRAQTSVNTALPLAISEESRKNVETSLPDAPSPSAEKSNQAQSTDQNRDEGQHGTQQAKAQPAFQPNVPFPPPRYNRPLQPMDLGDKFKYFVEPAFGPRSFVTNTFGAGIRMANPPSNAPHEWRAGGEAFGRLYGDSFARTGAESIGRFSASALLHEDPRYRRSGSTFFPTRLGHAFVFTFIDKTDGGRTTVALSNFTGAAAGGFIGNAYLPPGFDNLTHAGQRSAVTFGGIAAKNVLQEFSPEIGQFLRKIHLPHIPLPPVWWTR
jgi:hypothetical protein